MNIRFTEAFLNRLKTSKASYSLQISGIKLMDL